MRTQAAHFDLRSIFSQNMQGMKTDSQLRETVSVFRARHAYAAGFQETWRCSSVEDPDHHVLDGCTYMGMGLKVQQCNRGQVGVGLLLSRSATSAWEAAGKKVHRISGRVIAAPLLAKDPRTQKELGLYMLSGYAPTSNATDQEMDEFYDAFNRALARKPVDYVLVACIDGNASIGHGIGHSDPSDCYGGAVGSFGINHINSRGRRLRAFLEMNQLASLASYFHKRHYSTWVHPLNHHGYQLDHIVVTRQDIKRFTDAGSCPFQFINSDHRPVGCKLRIAVNLQRKPDQRGKLVRLDYSSLFEADGQCAFARGVLAHLRPGEEVTMPLVTYSKLAAALHDTMIETLPKQPHPTPSWFEAKAELLHGLINARNLAFNARQKLPGLDTASRLKQARSELLAAVRNAKSSWIVDLCESVNDGIVSSRGSKFAWDTVGKLRAGLEGATKRSAPAKMKKADGSLATTPEENAGVFADHFDQLYGVSLPFDPSVLDLLPQRDAVPGLDHAPTDQEIRRALSKLHDTGPGVSGLPARVWKALGSTDESFALVRQMVLIFWETEEMPEEWETGLLKILAKKGDLSLAGN